MTYCMDICWKAVYARKKWPWPKIIAAAERMRRRRVDEDKAEQRLAQLLGEGCWRQRLEMLYALCLHGHQGKLSLVYSWNVN